MFVEVDDTIIEVHGYQKQGAGFATIGRKLIAVPARVVSSGRRVTLHPPQAWPWEAAWTVLFTPTGQHHHNAEPAVRPVNPARPGTSTWNAQDSKARRSAASIHPLLPNPPTSNPQSPPSVD